MKIEYHNYYQHSVKEKSGNQVKEDDDQMPVYLGCFVKEN